MTENLIIVTHKYPYGNGEEFFETEIKYLSEKFNHIYIISLSEDKFLTRIPPENVKIINYKININIFKKISTFKYFLNKDFFKELLVIRNFYKLKINIKLLKHIIENMLIAENIEKLIKQNIMENNIKGKTYLYSYWMGVGALAISNYKKKNKNVKAFCRSHRSDLYFEENINNYLPFRTFILKELDNVFLISNDGKKYLESKFSNIDKNKLVVSRLGINNPNIISNPSKNNILRLVSCSYITEVKRINLIVEALSGIDDILIQWTHIGDGDMRSEIENMTKIKLGKKENIVYEFMGYLSNYEVYQYYKNNEVDLFINVSESEGIPVSMMESLSFSIPIVGTNVGGVSEIINGNNGILISPNPSIDEIRAAILTFTDLSNFKIDDYRKNAYKMWKKKYNAESNYKDFIKMIKEI